MSQDNGFIQKRLDSLNEIDNNIVTLLDNIGSVFNAYVEPSTLEVQDLTKTKEKFVEGTKLIYLLLGSIAIGLRKEVKIMDENIGVYDKNEENVMILPISVDQKHTTLGRDRLEKEVRNMEQLVGRFPEGSSTKEEEKPKEDDAMDISDLPEPKAEEPTEKKEPAEPEEPADITID